MNFYQFLVVSSVILFAGLPAGAEKKKEQAPEQPGTVIQTETKLVLVDAVVTDKKGNYIKGLTTNDFRVWEDNKEQTIKSFSSEADAAATITQQARHLVLFFDNSNMDFSQQAVARKAAAKFVDRNAGPNRLIAIVNYGGSLRVAQNFTADAVLLKAVVSGVKIASLTNSATTSDSGETATSGMPQLGRSAGGFGARSVLLALKTLAKNLSPISGRKMLILFTAGFPVNIENFSEVTAAVNACNHSNVAIYPVDVRGLVSGSLRRPWTYAEADTGLRLERASFLAGTMRLGMAFQAGSTGGGGSTGGAGGGGRGAGGITPGGSTGGAPGGATGLPGAGGRAPGSNVGGNSPGNTGGFPGSRGPGGEPGQGGLGSWPGGPGMNRPSVLIPQMPEMKPGNENVMLMLANGTGGFVIRNTNDLSAGLEKIANELNQYYVLGYTPPESKEGSCHMLRVKVERGGTVVRARSGYCNEKPKDILAGKDGEKQLEAKANLEQAAKPGSAIRLPYFYTSANVARVNLALDLPPGAIEFKKDKGKFKATVNLLGIAYREDGSVAARFSDSVKMELDDKNAVKKLESEPAHYDNQFEVASGSYKFRLLYGAGDKSFGKIEAPLVVEPYSDQQFAISALALSKQARKTAEMGEALDSALMEDRTPLVYNGVQFVPCATSRFKKDGPALLYFEIYEPFLTRPRDAKSQQVVAMQYKVVDRKTGKLVSDSGLLRIELPAKGDTPVIPIASSLPVKSLTPGSYVFDVTAVDSLGKQARRSATFEVE